MAKIIGLPKLSPTMEEGTLVRWVKQEGDAVEVDDLIAEVETDKATMEFRSFDKGVLLKQLAAEGATLAPDQPVMIFGKPGDDISALLEQAGGGASASPSDEGKPKPKQPPADAAQQGARGQGKPPQVKSDDSDAPDDTEEGEAPAEVGAEADARAAADASAREGQAPGKTKRVEGRVLASPVVRKLARENDIDLTSVQGSGPNGRVIKRDVEGGQGGQSGQARVGLPGAALRGPSAPPPPLKGAKYAPPPSGSSSSAASSASSSPASPSTSAAPSGAAPVAVGEGDRTEKLSSMRKTIARRLTESKREVPHFYLTIDIDAEPLVALRTMFNERLAKTGDKLSLNDFIIKACASALRRMPKVNVSFAGDSVIYHDGVHISVAVAIPDGLVTPVIRHADRLGVLAISQAVKELAGRAKEKKLKLEEMQGGTFSISNLGMYGIDEFSAVINPPEGAILAIGAVRDEPVIKAGAVVPGKRMALTMSCDHRVVDGALGAEWLKLLRTMLESPMTMLM
jgi:pyruvate dehydrogenase E2 component (dihydrolipoamide acetyltransferase)